MRLQLKTAVAVVIAFLAWVEVPTAPGQATRPRPLDDTPRAYFPHVLARRLEREDLQREIAVQREAYLRADRDLDRAGELVQQGALGRSQLERFEALRGIARAKYDALIAKLALYDHELAILDGKYRGGPETGYNLLLEQVRSQVEAAEVEARYMNTRYNKNRRLHEAGALSATDLTDSALNRAVTMSRLYRLRARLAQVEMELVSFRDPDSDATDALVEKLKDQALEDRIRSQQLIAEVARIERDQARRRAADDDRSNDPSNGIAEYDQRLEEARDELERLQRIYHLLSGESIDADGMPSADESSSPR